MCPHGKLCGWRRRGKTTFPSGKWHRTCVGPRRLIVGKDLELCGEIPQKDVCPVRIGQFLEWLLHVVAAQVNGLPHVRQVLCLGDKVHAASPLHVHVAKRPYGLAHQARQHHLQAWGKSRTQKRDETIELVMSALYQHVHSYYHSSLSNDIYIK